MDRLRFASASSEVSCLSGNPSLNVSPIFHHSMYLAVAARSTGQPFAWRLGDGRDVPTGSSFTLLAVFRSLTPLTKDHLRWGGLVGCLHIPSLSLLPSHPSTVVCTCGRALPSTSYASIQVGSVGFMGPNFEVGREVSGHNTRSCDEHRQTSGSRHVARECTLPRSASARPLTTVVLFLSICCYVL